MESRRPGDHWFRLTGAATACLSILAAFAFVRVWMARRAGYFNINDAYFLYQDALVPGVFVVIYLVAGTPLRGRLADWTGFVLRRAGQADLRFVAAAAVGLTAALWAGATFVVGSVRLSGDEFFADFDARIFAAGRLTAPISPQWRPFAHALQPIYASVTPAGWSSVDLPLNSVIRAAFARIGLADLTGAVLAALSIFLVWRLARRFWPARRDAAVLAVALLACSPQFLATAMTPYAMTADLAFDLAWLSLFLIRKAPAQLAATVVAFAACGLHKWLFAPLFAAPFLIVAWCEGRRIASAAGAATFALSVAFWISWPGLRSLMLGYPMSDAGWTEIGKVASVAGWIGAPPIMADNLVRFAVWQNPMALPLALAGGLMALTRPAGLLTAMAAGPIIAVAVLTIVFPFQGHGWGFRYLHDYLGSVSLLAAAAWVRMVPKGDGRVQRAALVAVALGALVILPAQIILMRIDLDRFAGISRTIARAPVDVVVVDTQSDPFANDFVRNDPFLTNRPKVMELDELSDAQITALTASHSVERFTLRGDKACLAAIVSGRGSGSGPIAGERCQPLPRRPWP